MPAVRRLCAPQRGRRRTRTVRGLRAAARPRLPQCVGELGGQQHLDCLGCGGGGEASRTARLGCARPRGTRAAGQTQTTKDFPATPVGAVFAAGAVRDNVAPCAAAQPEPAASTTGLCAQAQLAGRPVDRPAAAHGRPGVCSQRQCARYAAHSSQNHFQSTSKTCAPGPRRFSAVLRIVSLPARPELRRRASHAPHGAHASPSRSRHYRRVPVAADASVLGGIAFTDSRIVASRHRLAAS